MIEGKPRFEEEPGDDLLQEACGIVGVVAPNGDVAVAGLACSALASLQHRGEGAAGILNSTANKSNLSFVGIKNTGLVAEVFPDSGHIIDQMSQGAVMSIGQVRWPTSGGEGDAFHQAQPLDADNLVVAQNGHIETMQEIAEGFGIKNTVSDGDALTRTLGFLARPENAGSTLDAMHTLFPHLDGGYSLIVADAEYLHGVRDPWGTRPLWLGQLASGAIMVASEQPALHEAGHVLEEREVGPGEIVSIATNGDIESSLIQREGRGGLCALEGVYFARPDGKLDGRSIYQSRHKMGERLAQEHPVDADIVIGVPDSGTIAAMGFAKESGIPYAPGLFRNTYTTRTFIQSSPEERRRMVLRKLRPNHQVLDGQRVVVVDDSIVRGTSTETLTEVLRGAGAREVHYRISSAPFVNACFSGTAISQPEKLFARRYPTPESRQEHLKADSLEFLSVEGLAESMGKKVGSLCMGCMTGEYPFQVPVPTAQDRQTLPIVSVR